MHMRGFSIYNPLGPEMIYMNLASSIQRNTCIQPQALIRHVDWQKSNAGCRGVVTLVTLFTYSGCVNCETAFLLRKLIAMRMYTSVGNIQDI